MPVQPWTGRFPRSQLFDEQRTDGVEHCQDHHTHIGEDGQPHIGEPQGHKHQTRQLDADGKDDVFIDDPQALAGDPNGLCDFGGIVIHQDHVGGLDGGIGAHGAHGNTDIRPAEDRGVVDAVPHEGQLSEVISKEPLGPAVRRGDDEWFQIVRWSFNTMVEAEELGITKANADELRKTSANPNLQRLLGQSDDMGKLIGLDKEWSYRIIKQVGNYGESWTEFFGPKTPLNLPRGLNRLWTDGGLMYAMPIR